MISFAYFAIPGEWCCQICKNQYRAVEIGWMLWEYQKIKI